MKKQHALLSLLCIVLMALSFAGCSSPDANATDSSDMAIDANSSTTQSENASEENGSESPEDVIVKPPVIAQRPNQDATRSEDAGHLTVDRLEYDFGEIEPRQKVHGKFLLKNDGKETLEIEKPIGKSCGCTVPTLSSYVLEPGQTVPLEVEFNAGTHAGKTSKKIWANVKAPGLPERLTMSINATIRTIVEVEPQMINFEARPDGNKNLTITLSSRDNEKTKFNVTSISSTARVVSSDYDKSITSDTHVIPITVDVDRLIRTPRGAITITINHPRLKSVVVNFKSVLPYSAHPPTKAFLNIKPGETKTATIKINSNFDKEFELGEMESSKDLIKVLGTKKVMDGYEVEISFTAPADIDRQFINDYLTVNFKGDSKNTLKIQCYARISK